MRGKWLSEKSHLSRINYLVLLAFLVLNGPAMATGTNSSDSLSVVYCRDCIPFEFQNEAGEPAGMIIDLWKLWSNKTGIDLDYRAAPWTETLSMAREGKVDAHAGLFYSEARDEYLTYGPRLSKTDTHVFYHHTLPIAQNQDILPYRVGVIKGDYVEGYLSKTFPGLAVVGYSDYEELISDLSNGRLKVFAADTLTGLQHLQKSGLATEFQYKANQPLYKSDWFAAVPEGNEEALARIERGMQLISVEEKLSITRRWIVSSGGRDPNTLVIAIDRKYPPFSLLGPDGKPTGMMVEFWRQWSKATDIPVNFLPVGWAETLEALKSGLVDIHFGLFRNSEREAWMQFSQALHEIETAVYFRAEEIEPPLLAELAGKRVAVLTGSYQESYLRRHHTGLQLVNLPDGEAMIIALLKGAVDALVDEIPTVETNLSHLQLTGALVKSNEILFANTIHAGVRKGRENLVASINAGFTAIPAERLAEIESRWITNPDDRYYRAVDDDLGLSKKEMAWTRTHPVIRVAATPDRPPFEFRENGRYRGIHADILRLVAEKTGLKIEPVFDKLSTMTQKLKNEEVDLCLSLNATDERKSYLIFTEPFSEYSEIIITREKDSIASIKNLGGRTVSVEKGNARESFLKNNYPSINRLVMENSLNAIRTVITGQADAYIGSEAVSLYLIKKNRLTGIKVAGFFDEAPSRRYQIAVIRNKQMLSDILQKGLNAITQEEMTAVYEKWFGQPMAKDKISLTMDEEHWLEVNKSLRVGIQPNHPPIEFFNKNGTYSGISSGFLNILCEPLGIKILPAEKLSASDLAEKIATGDIDVLPAVTSSKDLGETMVFTQPYLSFPIVIIMQKDAPIISSIEDLAGSWVGIIKEHVAGSQLMDDYAFLNYVFQNSVEDALMALSKGDIDAFVGDLATASYNMELLGLSNLKIAAPTPYKIELRIGVKKAWAPLAGMFDKILSKLSESEKSAIKNQWIAIKFEHGLELKTVLKWVLPIVAVLVAILLFTIMWNRRLGKEISQRKAAENRFVSLIEGAPDAMIIVNESGRIVLVNSQTEILFGYDRKELLDQPIELLVPEDKRNRHVELREDFVKDPAVRLMGDHMNLAGRDKSGRLFPADISLSPLETDAGLVVVASIRDVTERKKAEEALAAAEEQNRLVLESVGEGILGVDTHGKVTFINPSAEKLLGFTAQELIGQSVHEGIQHTQLDGTVYEKDDSPIYATYTQGFSNRISDEVLWRKDGTRFFAEYYSTPIRKDDGVVGAVVTFNDISERIEIQEKLKKNIEGLERFSKLAVGREKSMIELKHEINTMLSETGQKPKYKIVTEEAG